MIEKFLMPQTNLHRTALNLLARREHSQKELFRKLLQKKFPAEEIEIVLKKLTQENLLNENRFIENYIHFRSKKGYGPIRIQLELLERGIPEIEIEKFLSPNSAHWFQAANHVWQKRFKNKLPTDFKTRAQQMRFLQHRGFTIEQIEKIFFE